VTATAHGDPAPTIVALEASVQAAAVTAFGAILVALIGIALELLRRNNKRLGSVQQQVQNSHPTNLRADVDDVLAALERIERTQGQHGDEIGGLREEIRHERAERLDVERRIDRLTD
jgi:hypothetical protein